MADEEKIYIRVPVSGKLLGALIAALAVAFGTYPIVNRANPDARADPFTGAEGKRLEDRIEVLELDVAQCQKDNTEHREAQASAIAELKATQGSNRYLIERCMNVVGG